MFKTPDRTSRPSVDQGLGIAAAPTGVSGGAASLAVRHGSGLHADEAVENLGRRSAGEPSLGLGRVYDKLALRARNESAGLTSGGFEDFGRAD